MTVRELCLELSKYDPDLPVRYCNPNMMSRTFMSRMGGPLPETETESCDVVEYGEDANFVALV